MFAVTFAVGSGLAGLGGALGAELLGQIPLEPAVAHGGDVGEPIEIDGSSAAARVFADIAKYIESTTVSVSELSGCSARDENVVAVSVRSQSR